jgi:hypothetical protein
MRFTQEEISSNCIPFEKAIDLLKFELNVYTDPMNNNDIIISGESKILKIKFKYNIGKEILCGFDVITSLKFTIMKNLQLEELLSVQIDVSDDTVQLDWLIKDNLKQLGPI